MKKDFYYALINDEKICTGISQLSGKVEDSNMIELDEFITSVIGKMYIDNNWKEVENKIQTIKTLSLQTILETINALKADLEIGGII